MTWWFCADQDNAERYVWIDCDRWYDARRTAWTILGSEKIWVTHPKTDQTRPPKKAYQDRMVYQAKWEGSAAGFNDLHMEVTRVLMRKWLCRCCSELFWPWELLESAGKLVHIVQPDSYCGPVVDHRSNSPSKHNTSSLPVAEPYDDEKEQTNGATPTQAP